MLNEAEAQVKEFTNSSDIIRSLAAQLLSEEDYKLQCSDYFSNISDDGSIVSLKFPYFNLLFLVLYLIILTTQGLTNFIFLLNLTFNYLNDVLYYINYIKSYIYFCVHFTDTVRVLGEFSGEFDAFKMEKNCQIKCI